MTKLQDAIDTGMEAPKSMWVRAVHLPSSKVLTRHSGSLSYLINPYASFFLVKVYVDQLMVVISRMKSCDYEVLIKSE